MKRAATYLIFILLVLFLKQADAQTTEWIQGFDNHYTTNPIITNDFSDNVILGCATRDSFTFKGHTIKTASLSFNLILAKFTNDDSLIWLYSTLAYSGAQTSPASVSCDNNNNIYVLLGYSNNIVKLGKHDSLIGTSSTTKSALLKFSPNGALLWYRDFGVIRSSKVRVSQNNVYILNSITNGSSLYCYDTAGNYKFTNTYTNVLLNLSDLVVNESNKNEIYISAKNTKSFTYNSISYSAGSYIFALDTNGNVTNHIKITGAIAFIKFDVDFEHPKKPIYIAFNFGDTFTVNTNKFKFSSTGSGASCGFIRVDDFKKVAWVKYTTSITNSSVQPLGGVKIRGSNMYVSSILQAGDSYIGSVVLQRKSGGFDLCLIKFDSLGNVLWGFTDGTSGGTITIYDIKLDSQGDLYVAGVYLKKVKIFNDSLMNITKNAEAFYARISNYSITRGKVSSGPYCAGDTIRIPFTKKGEFDTGNIFIAELSDENGDFDGKENELGRIKTNKDSVIIGKLPLFKVVTSGSYRIRIRATRPYVQSFYRKDSLRLLIYSRDKANPGPPETICKGDTIQISTFGGTKWKWSPRYRMNDSTLRQPLVWPPTTTSYKIIIADSSGCGAPDTAYKTIFVRHELKAVPDFSDKGLCQNLNLKILVHFMGGDSNYHWNWYLLSSTSSWAILGKGDLKQDDTLSFNTTFDSSNSTQKLALILSDECASKKDTSFINLRLLRRDTLANKIEDSTVCNGAKLKWKSNTSADKGTYTWKWEDMTSNKLLSNTDSLELIATIATKIKLTLTTLCNVDTSVFTVFVKPPLKASIFSSKITLKDTSICFGQILKLNAVGKGGDTSTYNFNWYLNQSLLSNSDTFNLKTDLLYTKSGGIKTLKLTLSDKCSAHSDSVSRIIEVNPSPVADFTWGALCSRTTAQFTFTGTVPASPVNTTYAWQFPKDSSKVQNPSVLLNQYGINTVSLTLISNNGCKHQLSKDVEVKLQSKADFSANDVCETDSAIFSNQSNDATAYNWKFGDGLNSAQTDPKHLYNIGGITKTYNVTLVAVSGCSDSITKALTINANPISDFSYTRSGSKLDLKAKQINNSKYRWKFGSTDSVITSTNTHTQTLANSSQYKVCLKVTNIAGCVSETCKDVTVGIKNLNRPAGFKLYPNPNSGNFTLEIDNPGTDLSIAIYDLLGNQIKTVESFPDQTSYLLDLNVAEGMYNVRLRNGDKVYYQKVIICH